MGEKVTFSPLENYVTYTTLIDFCDFLKSHHNERYKLIINSCNNILLSCHHLTSINHVEFSHPVCQFISYLMKELPYTGLYCGIITTTYLSKLLKLSQQVQPSIPQKNIVLGVETVKEFVLNYVDKLKNKQNLEGHRLVSVVKAVLKNLLEQSFVNRLAVTVVKATLLAVDERSSKLGHITIKTFNGVDSCEAYTGVLYKEESLWMPKNECLGGRFYRLMLLTEPLAIVSDRANSKISEAEFISSVIAANINVVACQKSVDKKIIFELYRHNIIVMERLGEESANALAVLSGAFPVSDHNRINMKDLNLVIGVTNSLTRIKINNQSYLLMDNNNKKVVTLFVSHRTFDTSDQLKNLIKESIQAVYSIFKEPYFLPEDFDCSLVDQLVNYKSSDLLLKKMMALFATSIGEAATTSLVTTCRREDIYLLKRNALLQVFFTVTNLLQVGMFVQKKKIA